MADPSSHDDDEPEVFHHDEDDDDLLDDECGMGPDGLCQLAGTEWCDWHCKMRD